jgi:hypothetical protein
MRPFLAIVPSVKTFCWAAIVLGDNQLPDNYCGSVVIIGATSREDSTPKVVVRADNGQCIIHCD